MLPWWIRSNLCLLDPCNLPLNKRNILLRVLALLLTPLLAPLLAPLLTLLSTTAFLPRSLGGFVELGEDLCDGLRQENTGAMLIGTASMGVSSLLAQI